MRWRTTKLSKIKGILFDKDGTLIDFNSIWIPVIKELVNEVCCELKCNEDENIKKKLYNSIGVINGKVDSKGVYASKTASDLANCFISVFEDNNIKIAEKEIFKQSIISKLNYLASDENREINSIGNIEELFKKLKEVGIYIGISTADTKESTENSLKKLGVYKYFDFIGADDGYFKSKPEPHLFNEFCRINKLQSNEVAVIGDTIIDMNFGKNSNAGLVIGVLSGVSEKEELKELADEIITSVESLINEDGMLVWEANENKDSF
jgi:phosphoglycolate phosphatase